jgi:hypothetical protein
MQVTDGRREHDDVARGLEVAQDQLPRTPVPVSGRRHYRRKNADWPLKEPDELDDPPPPPPPELEELPPPPPPPPELEELLPPPPELEELLPPPPELDELLPPPPLLLLLLPPPPLLLLEVLELEDVWELDDDVWELDDDDGSFGPDTVSPDEHPPSMPKPASAVAPESTFKNSRRSSRPFSSSFLYVRRDPFGMYTSRRGVLQSRYHLPGRRFPPGSASGMHFSRREFQTA